MKPYLDDHFSQFELIHFKISFCVTFVAMSSKPPSFSPPFTMARTVDSVSPLGCSFTVYIACLESPPHVPEISSKYSDIVNDM